MSCVDMFWLLKVSWILGKLNRGFAATKGLAYFDAQRSFWDFKNTIVIRSGSFMVIMGFVLQYSGLFGFEMHPSASFRAATVCHRTIVSARRRRTSFC